MRHWDRARSSAQKAKNVELGIYAAQSLARQTGDPLMKVDAALVAARAYALDGRYTACPAEFDKAMNVLCSAGEPPPESPFYWYHEGIPARKKSEFLLLLGNRRMRRQRPDGADSIRQFQCGLLGCLYP